MSDRTEADEAFPGRFDERLFDAAQSDVVSCRALYIAAVHAYDVQPGRHQCFVALEGARVALAQALVIRHFARGDGDR